MDNFNSFVLFFVAAVLGLATIAQGIVAVSEIAKKGYTHRVFGLGITLCFLFALLAGYGGVLQYAHSSNIPPAQSSPSVTVTAGDTQMPSPTDTTQPTDTPSPTDTAQSTGTPALVPTLPPTPGPANAAVTPLPFIMDCQCSNDPVKVRVTKVDINQSLGRMTWDLTLLNIGTEQLDPSFRQIALDLNGQLSFDS